MIGNAGQPGAESVIQAVALTCGLERHNTFKTEWNEWATFPLGNPL